MSERRRTHPDSRLWSKLGGEALRKKYREMGYTGDEDGYPEAWSKSLKLDVKDRDNWTCQDCGVKQNDLTKEKKWLGVHHLDGNKKNVEKDNLITLCRSCHAVFHHVDNGHQIKIREALELYGTRVIPGRAVEPISSGTRWER